MMLPSAAGPSFLVARVSAGIKAQHEVLAWPVRYGWLSAGLDGFSVAATLFALELLEAWFVNANDDECQRCLERDLLILGGRYQFTPFKMPAYAMSFTAQV